jgi:hypothetical protein
MRGADFNTPQQSSASALTLKSRRPAKRQRMTVTHERQPTHVNENRYPSTKTGFAQSEKKVADFGTVRTCHKSKLLPTNN